MAFRLPITICGILLITSAMTSIGQHMEKLDRGTVALTKGGGRVFISWRLLKSDPDNMEFDIYRENDWEMKAWEH